MSIIREKKKKIIKYEKIILQKELKFNIIKKYNIDELNKFFVKFNHYALILRLLHDDPTFYSTLKFIQLDQTNDIDHYQYCQIIWIHEHYELIEDIRSIEPDIKLLLSDSKNIGWISNIQYKLAKKIMKMIPGIFESDKIFTHLYSNKLDNNIPTNNQIDYLITIIGIIILSNELG